MSLPNRYPAAGGEPEEDFPEPSQRERGDFSESDIGSLQPADIVRTPHSHQTRTRITIASFPWREVLLNPYWMAASASAVAAVCLLVLNSLLSKAPVQPAIDPAVKALQDSNQSVLEKKVQIETEIMSHDFNPIVAKNGGDLQKTILTGGADLRASFLNQQGQDKKSANYGKHLELIGMRERVKLQKIINRSAARRRIFIGYIDETTGRLERYVPPASAGIAVGMVLQQVVDASERPTLQVFDLAPIAKDQMQRYSELKDTKSDLLRMQGMGPVAEELDNLDMYGQEIIPQPAPEVVEQPLPKPKRSPPPLPPKAASKTTPKKPTPVKAKPKTVSEASDRRFYA